MTMQEIKEQCKEIEEMTGRSVRLEGTTINKKPAVIININGRVYRCVFLSELYWALSDVYWVINALQFGENPVEF